MTVREMTRFIMVGSIGFGVDFGVTWGLSVPLGLNPLVSRIFGILAAIVTTWFLNVTFTFASRIALGAAKPNPIAYGLAMLLALLVNYCAYWGTLRLLSGMRVDVGIFLAIAAGSIAGMFVNLLICDRLLFARLKKRAF